MMMALRFDLYKAFTLVHGRASPHAVLLAARDDRVTSARLIWY